MGFKDILRRVLHPPSTQATRLSRSGVPELPRRASAPVEDGSKEWAEAWLAAMERGDLSPPRDVHDAEGWNTYWTNQLSVGPVEQGFSDRMSSDDHLVGLLASRGARTIRCAGNGLSTEAMALAMHGFHVTVLDIASVPLDTMGAALRSPEHPSQRVPGYRIDNQAFVFGTSGPIPEDACPGIHRSPGHAPRCGGTLSLVRGDLSDPAICPGPFDAVIERRTVQLFPNAERELALDRLVSRLAERGLFVSHQHEGGWEPDSGAQHYAGGWLLSHGFVVDVRDETEGGPSPARLARLRFTTG